MSTSIIDEEFFATVENRPDSSHGRRSISTKEKKRQKAESQKCYQQNSEKEKKRPLGLRRPSWTSSSNIFDDIA